MIYGDSKFNKLTSLHNATYAEASNTTVVLSTAVANTKGVIIRRGNTIVAGAVYTAILVDGNPITLPAGGGIYSAEVSQVVENLYIPPGMAVSLISTSSSYKANAWYEVL